MESIVRRIGPLDPEARRRDRPDDAYGTLVRSIVGQQISTKAASAVHGRLLALFGERSPTPRELLSAEEESLRSAGLSRRKISYLRDLARRLGDGELYLDGLHALPDEEVISRLTAVRGLGRWTAEMFLMFHLRRPDVLPAGDLGIRRAARLAYDLPETPGAETLRKLAEPWRPERTLACIYLWESLS